MKKNEATIDNIYPFFFAIFPTATLFANNTGLVTFGETLSSLGVALCLAIILLLLLRSGLGNVIKANIIASIFLLFFFLFGHLLLAVRNIQIGNFSAGQYGIATFLGLILFLCCAYAVARAQGPLSHLTNLLKIMGIFLVAFPLFRVFTIYDLTIAEKGNITETLKGVPIRSSEIHPTKEQPDIYYFILDRYGAGQTLRDVYGFDNSDFLDFLSENGFYVASQSVANYLKTAHSLATSFNLQYINEINEQVGEESRNWRPLYTMLHDHRVARFLKSRGYQFLQFGSWWEPTRKNPYADRNVNVGFLPQFFYSLYEKSMIAPIAVPLGILDFRWTQWKRELHHFEELVKVPAIKEPTFVFAHILITHRPYVFDREGNFLSGGGARRKTRDERYVDQVAFANKKMKELIGKLLTETEGPAPIIIVQADEGPWPIRFEQTQYDFKWKEAKAVELREKMRILNAYYLPNVSKGSLYPGISPVNTFRLIFNLYFHTNFELLPDESYAYEDEYHPYKFFKVTDIVKYE
jgi:hypothetical protein